MKPIEFKHQTVIFTQDELGYENMPTLVIDDQAISCWKLTFLERLKVLFTGEVWLSMNNPLTPVHLAVHRKDVFSHPDDGIKWGLWYKNKS